tara:strand:+ start:845 stop:1465 length:621 start_codon:yes stop_codon:yes gene_type:complete
MTETRYLVVLHPSGAHDIATLPSGTLSDLSGALEQIGATLQVEGGDYTVQDCVMLCNGPAFLTGSDTTVLAMNRKTYMAGLSGEPVPRNDAATAMTGQPVYGSVVLLGVIGDDWVGCDESSMQMMTGMNLEVVRLVDPHIADDTLDPDTLDMRRLTISRIEKAMQRVDECLGTLPMLSSNISAASPSEVLDEASRLNQKKKDGDSE